MSLEENSITTESTKSKSCESLFYDSYAFFEILKENKNYEKYEECKIITTKLNMFELYLGVLREEGEEIAQDAFDLYYPFVKDFDEEVIRNAAQLKIQLNRRDVSMTDCIGYCFASQLGIKFLTGDGAFEKMENVEFVK